MSQPTTEEQDYIEVFGAREHNLKNIDIKIPRNKLVVFTGISGSGKSSLAFDTIYAEGQRRYMESFSAYARSFIGDMERPDVDKINGLSPVISIEQKTTSKNPRSSVGTTTEIYDFLRLLFARAGEAFSYVNGSRMAKMSEDQILDTLISKYENQKLTLLAPVVKGRKGHYRELFQSIRKSGFTKVRVDGEIIEIGPKTETDRYKIHNIEIVIDRIVAINEDRFRIGQSVKLAMTHGKGVILLLDESKKAHFFSKHLMDAESGIAYDDPAPNLFSPNSPYGWCPSCHGLGIIEEITESNILPDKSLSISRGAIAPLGEYRDIWIFGEINKILKKHKQSITTPIQDLTEDAFKQVMYGDGQAYIYGSVRNPDSFEGIVNYLKRQLDEGSEKTKEWIEEYVTESVCPTCNGQKLRIEALHFKIDQKNISEISCMQLDQLAIWVDQLYEKLDPRQKQIAEEVIKEISKRLGFLLDVGLEYLTLDRRLKTLSGGEAQRIRLATQIGSQLVGVLYILDEPSIGLHQRDNEKLIKSLINLRDIGNTVLVVEHDKDMMLASDFVVDIGPGAGIHGGKVVNANIPSEFVKQDTTTSKYLSGVLKIKRNVQKELQTEKKLILRGAKGNNLKDLTLELPLGNLICITGVSGSGKSTLIHDTLFPILNKYFFNAKRDPLTYDSIEGLEHIDKVIEVDQAPIGRTPRSNPATYTGVFTEIRALFAQMNEAKIRGYSVGRFSFNVKGGRCEVCEGAGMRVIEMEFLPDVHVHCDQCKGKRYNRETLEIRFKGKSISDVLDMTVEQAVGFFENQPRIYRYVKTLNEVGLGYITLGQHATTLSGGEAQRVKLASELSKKDTGRTLYILDEPTTGLHFQDIKHLLDVLSKLVERGNTVLVIEHNMDIIKCADWIIDIGPDSGKAGGEVVVEGTPKKVSETTASHTGRFLKMEL